MTMYLLDRPDTDLFPVCTRLLQQLQTGMPLPIHRLTSVQDRFLRRHFGQQQACRLQLLASEGHGLVVQTVGTTHYSNAEPPVVAGDLYAELRFCPYYVHHFVTDIAPCGTDQAAFIPIQLARFKRTLKETYRRMDVTNRVGSNLPDARVATLLGLWMLHLADAVLAAALTYREENG